MTEKYESIKGRAKKKSAKASKRTSATKKSKTSKKTKKSAPAKRAGGVKAKKATKRKTTAPKKRAGGGGAKKPKAATPTPTPRKRAAPKLSAKDLEQFRELLLQKRAELAGDVLMLQDGALNLNRQDAAGDLSSMPIHMADLGSDNYEKEFTLGLIEGERELLREIDAALGRIQDGTYGVCEATGRPISKARLKARPWARYCYEYVLAQESGRPIGA